ncbi:hypothetical protein [Enterococcus faecalis]|uniref:hypothetical protein n=1 Tax=Enterococcus faecalis TaxID=1351 RepID=UPI0034D01A82
MIINEQKVLKKYISYAIKHQSFDKNSIRNFTDSENFSPFYIYKYFGDYKTLKIKAAEAFVAQVISSEYINFNHITYSNFLDETIKYFKKHEYRNLLFLDDYCGKIIMNEYYIPSLRKYFKNNNEAELTFKYVCIVGMILKK